MRVGLLSSSVCFVAFLVAAAAAVQARVHANPNNKDRGHGLHHGPPRPLLKRKDYSVSDSSSDFPTPNCSPSEFADWNLEFNNFTGVFTIRNGTQEQQEAAPGGGGLYHQRSWGLSNNLCHQQASESQMTPEARFPIASNTKLFTAVALYQLQEQGKVNLTDNIADYITPADLVDIFGFPNGTTRYCPQVQAWANGGPGAGPCQNITFVHILSMTSNIPPITSYAQTTEYSGSWSYAIGLFMTKPLLAKPGTKYFYSNPSFELAAWFITKLSGVSFRRYLQDFIITPLGLKNTYYPRNNGMFHQDPLRVQELNFYLNIDNRSKVISTGTCMGSDFAPGGISGAGGLVSTQGDLAKWWFALFNFTRVAYSGPLSAQYPYLGFSGTLLSAQSIFDIVQARTLTGGTTQFYGQGIGIFNSHPHDVTNPPNQIYYEGGLLCAMTSNQLNLDTKPFPVLMQAWSSANVFYVTSQQFDAAVYNDDAPVEGNWQWIVYGNQWPQKMDNSQMVYGFMEYYVNKTQK